MQYLHFKTKPGRRFCYLIWIDPWGSVSQRKPQIPIRGQHFGKRLTHRTTESPVPPHLYPTLWETPTKRSEATNSSSNASAAEKLGQSFVPANKVSDKESWSSLLRTGRKPASITQAESQAGWMKFWISRAELSLCHQLCPRRQAAREQNPTMTWSSKEDTSFAASRI